MALADHAPANGELDPLLRYPALPTRIVDSNGKVMDVGGQFWRFNYSLRRDTWNTMMLGESNPWFAYAVKAYVIYRIQKGAPIDANNTAFHIVNAMEFAPCFEKLKNATRIEQHRLLLNQCVDECLDALRAKRRDYRFHRVRAWYQWCADRFDDIGFDYEHALALSRIKVPGNEKGVAVRRDDDAEGPLSEEEFIVLREALHHDHSTSLRQVQQRVACWLAMAFGRNAANYALLREEDFVCVSDDGTGAPIHLLRMPRIKKRADYRVLFKEVYLDPSLAGMISDLIRINAQFQTSGTNFARPLFFRAIPSTLDLGTEQEEWAYHMTSNEFARLIRFLPEKLGIKSPRTGDVLKLSPRRLRYTYATRRVLQGASRAQLAEELDHSDMQHVQVYIDASRGLLEPLDKAIAMRGGVLIGAFKGTLVASAEQAINGDSPAKHIRHSSVDRPADLNTAGVCGADSLCLLYPPWSCYLCRKFQPFIDGPHQDALDELLRRRAAYESGPDPDPQMALNLTEIIYAVGAVIAAIERARQ